MRWICKAPVIDIVPLPTRTGKHTARLAIGNLFLARSFIIKSNKQTLYLLFTALCSAIVSYFTSTPAAMQLLILSLLLLTYARAQDDACTCSCCLGLSCSAMFIGNYSMAYCTTQKCRDFCRSISGHCQADYPDGQLQAVCVYSREPLFNCDCHCCNTGSALCTPVYVGASTAFACQTGACSLSCNEKYPTQCVNNQNGQTNGTCVSSITTTTTTTTTTTSLMTAVSTGRNCSCWCCPSGPTCIPDIYVGDAPVTTCSPVSCAQACQQRYPAYCPNGAELGRVNGTCSNPVTGSRGRSIEFTSTVLFFFFTFVFLYE